ncbi:AraC family transcriptional regulator [Paenibacillus agricola]|uniref:Helix-turn-helix transcriptional regulator n=1 Tax=Paenibacillus agricola TaxID=2716264 RepID=A0ABX0J666_9BACL|nr:AraC family transcriptional regulator [Paenibacillus agricola]NHN31912.1 helix-turn-helix transcriptional regulator [Paenibacillus agricola]
MKSFGNLRVRRYHYSHSLKEFMLAEDTYQHWVILAAHSGRFLYSLDGSPPTQEAILGDLVFCPAGQTLRRYMLEPTAFHFIEFEVYGSWPAGKVKIHDLERLSSTFQFLKELRDEAPAARAEAEAHLISDLLFLTAREGRVSSQLQQRTADPLMHEAAAYIQQHACETELSMQQLSQSIGLSASQLTRRFQSTFSSTPVEYATQIRLQKARRLLLESLHTLDDIAVQCGYQNGFYFSRLFTKKMGINPSEFRRKHRI